MTQHGLSHGINPRRPMQTIVKEIWKGLKGSFPLGFAYVAYWAMFIISGKGTDGESTIAFILLMMLHHFSRKA